MKKKIEISIKRSMLVSVLMMATFFYTNFMTRSEAIPPRKPLSEFPKEIGQWIGTEEFLSQKVYDILGVDDSVLIAFRNHDKNRAIQLYVGFYHSQREGDIIHSPKNCIPAAGWNITTMSFENLRVSGRIPQKIKVIKFILEKGDQKQVVLYWFQSRGRFIASEYLQKIYLVWDAIFKNRTDGAFVRLIAPVVSEDIESTTDSLKLFAENLIPILKDFLPGA